MENASKALLIAAVAMVTIALISLAASFVIRGNFLVSTFTDQISQTELKNHNNKFMKYDGAITGMDAISACQAVALNNAEVPEKAVILRFVVDSGTTYTVGVSGNNSYSQIANMIEKTRQYSSRVVLSGKGLVSEIIINN